MINSGWARFWRLVVCVAGISGSAGLGQNARNLILNRPSEQGPSAHLGIVGGYNTYLGPTGQTRSRGDYQSFGGQAFPRTNGFSGAFRGGYGASSDPFQTGSVKPASLFSAQNGRRYALFPASIGLANSAELRQASALEEAMSLDQPLMGWESPRVDIPNTPFYVETSAGTTAFHQFLGLTPSRPAQPLPDVLQKSGTYSALVEQMNDATIRATLLRANRAFKIGTTRAAEDRYEQLAVARRLYSSVLEMDHSAYLPALLSVHAAIGKEQYEVALASLLEALKRHPALFAERPDISEYFGEADLLDEQSRRFLRAGEANAQSASSWMMQAYSAWQLKDSARLQEAVKSLEQLHRAHPADRVMAAYLMALKAAAE